VVRQPRDLEAEVDFAQLRQGFPLLRREESGERRLHPDDVQRGRRDRAELSGGADHRRVRFGQKQVGPLRVAKEAQKLAERGEGGARRQGEGLAKKAEED